MSLFPKQYDPAETEKRWQARWEESGIHAWKNDSPRERTFVIDTPPPTVSGVLHMGHIFSYTQADFVARYQRMSGKDVFYPMGFDDNGLPTERLVEKSRNVRGSAMPRAEFVALCREVVQDAEEEFRRLFKSVALSVDWSREYQTISSEVRRLSQESFLDLLARNEAYRDFRPTYWDWVDQTAIAQAEIEEKEQPGIQCYIPFGLIDARQWEILGDSDASRPDFASLERVSVMTTRPELLGACVALMCHPDDQEKYHNKVAVTPLFNVVVPVCFDPKVDKEKGTGFVMCCSWGDDTDKEWIAKHKLAWRPLIQESGKLKMDLIDSTHHHPDAKRIRFYAGRNGEAGRNMAIHDSSISQKNCLDVNACNNIFLQLDNTKLIRDIKNENSAKGRSLRLLEAAGLLLQPEGQTEKIIPKTQIVKCAERSGAAIEIIPTHQWFVRIADKKEALLEKGAQCEWHPEFMRLRLNQWIEGLKEDWCISRQRFFGVPFPVWYSLRESEQGKMLLPDPAQLPIDPLVDLPAGYKREEVQADKDVMDTWATSSISPQINAGRSPGSGIRNPGFLFPADLRPQAHEIIRTWAFYTIVKAHLHSDAIPWKHLMISGWCLAADKTKMSKSKGNVVTPVALIEEKGADAVRYWASTSRLGADTAFSEDVLKIGRKLVTKLWNASQLVASAVPDAAEQSASISVAQDGAITEPLDRWILSRLHKAIRKATQEFERFEYCDARVAIEDFFWNDFCDNYLELVKARAYAEAADTACPSQREGHRFKPAQASAHNTLRHCLDALLRLFAPFIPHVTEEIYAHLFAGRGSVHARGQWPKAEDYPCDPRAEQCGMAAVDALNVIRKAKSEANVSIKYPVTEVLVEVLPGSPGWQALEPVLADLQSAGNAALIRRETVPAQGGYASEKGWFRMAVALAPPRPLGD